MKKSNKKLPKMTKIMSWWIKICLLHIKHTKYITLKTKKSTLKKLKIFPLKKTIQNYQKETKNHIGELHLVLSDLKLMSRNMYRPNACFKLSKSKKWVHELIQIMYIKTNGGELFVYKMMS